MEVNHGLWKKKIFFPSNYTSVKIVAWKDANALQILINYRKFFASDVGSVLQTYMLRYKFFTSTFHSKIRSRVMIGKKLKIKSIKLSEHFKLDRID